MQNVNIDKDTGVISIQYTNVTQIADKYLTITPFVNQVTLDAAGADVASANIDWGCASETHATADSRNLGVADVTDPVAARYVPTECK